jgi:hypothetical protein
VERDEPSRVGRLPRSLPSGLLYNPQLWVELFVLVNLSFLVLDIYLAHSTNHFERWAESIPLYFSIGAPPLLVVGLIAWLYGRARIWQWTGQLMGWSAVVIGVAGVVLHLRSQFFIDRTLRSLTYGAPFAAPLAYSGLGLLLLMNRMVDPTDKEWAWWTTLLTLGGFIGNFVFSLTDHAQNGFFSLTEWIPVVSSAFAIGFLFVLLIIPVTRRFLIACTVVLAVQGVVGITGFIMHVMADLHGPSGHIFTEVVYGAPPLAPLLFPNLMFLGMIALWTWWHRETT